MKYIWEEKDIHGGLKFMHEGRVSVIGRNIADVAKPFVMIHDGYLVTRTFSVAEIADALNQFGCTPISG